MYRTFLIVSLLILCVSPVLAQTQPPVLAQWNVSDPENLYMDADDNLYAIRGTSGMTKYSKDGAVLQTWVGSFEDVVAAPDGNLFVLLGSLMDDPGSIQKMDASGTVIKEWSPKVTPTDRNVSPFAIALGPDGTVYMVDEGNQRVVKFSSEGEVLGHWSTLSPGSGPSWPTRIAVDGDGNLIIGDYSDAGYGRIKKYTPGGTRLATWTDILPDGESFYPADIALDRWDNIYVADSNHDIVIVYDHDGKPLGHFQAGDGETEALTEGIAVDGQGNSYVANYRTDAIRKFGLFGPAFSPVQEAAVMLHVSPAEASGDPCLGGPQTVEDIITEGHGDPSTGGSYYVYLLGSPQQFIGSQSAGINGFRLGIEYHTTGNKSDQGIRIHDWTQCAGLEFPQNAWPADGSGNTITWGIGDCQLGEIVTAGFFYVSAYSPSRMSAVGYPVTGEVQVANCLGAELDAQAPLSPIRLGWVALEEAGGCNPLVEPCYGPTDTESTTWGGLKVRYGRERADKPGN